MDKPLIKDRAISAYVEELESRLKKFEESPYVKHYLTILNQINDWSDQLEIREEEVTVEGEKVKITKGRIEIFGSKDDKEFDRSFKYFNEIDVIMDKLEKLRSKMSPENIEELRNKLKEDGMSVAEIIATNGKTKN